MQHDSDPTHAPAVGPNQLLRDLGSKRVRFSDPQARRRVEAAAKRRPQWTLVKQNVSRSVYRCNGGKGVGVLYLKHFHSPALLHRIQRRLRLSDVGSEMRFSRHLSRHNVPVPEVLATCCRNGSAWMISAGLEPTRPADVWHGEALARGDQRAIRTVTRALAELVGRMHATGVIHRDLHCGNVLVNSNDPGQLALTDLHRMRHRRRLSRRSRAANLAQLLHDRLLWTSRSERLRFLKHYIRATGAEGSLRGWVRMIEPLADRHSRRLYAQRDRRTVGRSRYFTDLSVDGYHGHVVLASKRRVPGSKASGLAFTAAQWRAALADPKALLSGPDVQVIKDSPSSLVVRRPLRVGDHELDVYIKRPRRKKAIRWVLDAFRRSRPIRAFRLGHALLARHIHNALPLAALEKRRGPLLMDSLLITEAVADGVHLHRFLTRQLAPSQADDPTSTARRRRLARDVLWLLGRLVRRLHAEGFAHRDLKASNLLVRWPGEAAVGPDIIMIDLDGLRRVRHVSQRLEFRGLMRLNVSLFKCPAVNHAGRLRMLLGYLRRPGVGQINFKPYWRELQRWSGQKLRRQIRSRQRRQRVQRRKQS